MSFSTEPLETFPVAAIRPPSKALLVVMHGLGDSAHGWDWLPASLGLPWLEYVFVNAPDPYYGGFSWYDLHGDSAPGILRSRALIHQLLDRLVAEGRDPATIGLLGFSQGCLMTFDAGFRYRARLGALVGISGYFHDASGLLATLGTPGGLAPALFTHGTKDPLIPLPPVRTQAEVLRQAGLDITWKEFEKAHTVAGEEEVAVIRSFLSEHLDVRR